MTRSLTLITLWLLAASADAEPTTDAPLQRIAFGSCANQNQPQPVWDAILQQNPDLFLLLGDNVYADSTDPNVIRAAYNKLDRVTGFRKLRNSCPLLATWDDHDYGINDGGSEHPTKRESQAAFLDFLRIPASSGLRNQEGVYQSRVIGPAEKRVQIILLDTRYHRGKLARIKIAGRSFYVPSDDSRVSMLGDQQWKWLAEQLKVPAALRLVVSSIQVLPTDHPFEKWQNLPHERRRLLELLRGAKDGAILLLSGDQHFGEVTELTFQGYPFREITSSGLTHHRGNIAAPNSHRVGKPLIANNFGILQLDWAGDATVTASICDVEGTPQIKHRYRLRELTPSER